MKTAQRPLRVGLLMTDERAERECWDAPRPTFGTAQTALLEGLANCTDLEVHVISCTKRPLPAVSRLGEHVHFHSLVVPQMGWLRSGYLGCIAAIRRCVSQLGIEVVHGHGSERYCAMAAAFSGCPNVITLHGNLRVLAAVRRARIGSYLWLSARLEGLAVSRAGGVISISRHTERTVAQRARRTWLVPNAVEAACFGVQRRPVDPPVVLCAADLVAHKNQLGLVRALGPLAERQRFVLRLVGRAEAADGYAQQVLSSLKGLSWAQYGGLCDRVQLREELATGALLALPSLEENCPMAVLEAQAAGVPVVAAAVGGLPELVTSGETGCLCGQGDDDAWRASVGRLLAEPEFGARLAAAARRQATARHHPDAVAARHGEIYRALAAAHQGLRGKNGLQGF